MTLWCAAVKEGPKSRADVHAEDRDTTTWSVFNTQRPSL